jgi:predicted GNAT family acetyltransferase
MQPEQTVVNNRQKHQFEIQLGHEFGLLTYRERPGQIELVHTEVPPSQRGKGIGKKIVKSALEYARQNQLQVIPSCRFVQAYLKRHPDAV